MNEINLPQNTVIALCVILGLLAIYLWRHLGAYQLHIEPKKSAEDNLPLNSQMTSTGLIFSLQEKDTTRRGRYGR